MPGRRPIARCLPTAPIEIIVLEDASRAPGIDGLARVRGIRLVENGENLGFLRTCNAAARLARGEFLFFLNNDTQVLPGWLEPMLALLRDRADTGAVGCKLLFPDGRLQEAGAMVWTNGTGLTYGRGDDPDKPEYNYVREVDYVSGAALMLRRSLFADLGGFDETFAPAYCEDSDLAFRIRQAGLKVLYQPRSCIVHFEGITNGTDLTQGIKRFNEVNQPKLLERWRQVLATEHYPPDMHVLRACERGRNRRLVLVLGTSVPAPSDTVFGLLCGLSRAGLVVKFWSLARPANPEPPEAAALQEFGVAVLRGSPEQAGHWVAQYGAELDAAILPDPDTAEAAIAALRLRSRLRLIYLGAWAGSGTPDGRERNIWRSVETVLHGSEEAARRAEWLEPSVDDHLFGTPAAAVLAGGGLDVEMDTFQPKQALAA